MRPQEVHVDLVDFACTVIVVIVMCDVHKCYDVNTQRARFVNG